MSAFTVYKNASGDYRWLLVSSSAYRDRDGEHVLKSALTEDVNRANEDGNYGPLLWWHTPYRLGQCDFNMMVGPLLYESGTFDRPEYAKAVQKSQGKLAVSLGFKALPWEPNELGEYSFIRRKERSILPSHRASNPFTRIINIKETPVSKLKVDQLKVKELADMLEITEDDVLGLVQKEVDQVSAAAGQAGLIEKAAGDEGSPEEEAAESPEEEAAEMAAGEAAGQGPGAETSTGEESLFTDAELQQIAQAVAPIVAQAVIDAIGPALDMEGKLAKHAADIKATMGGIVTKAAGETPAAGSDDIEALKLQLKEMKDRVASLEGDLPAGSTGRASTDPSNVLIGNVLKELITRRDGLVNKSRQQDPLDSIVDGILGITSASA